MKRRGGWPKGRKRPHVRWQEGEKNHMAKLTVQQVREIRRRFDRGDEPQEIADDFGVVRSNVHMIGLRQRWGWLE